jgi:hypothetical protein
MIRSTLFLVLAFALLLVATTSSAQEGSQKKSKFFLTAGYGLAGSFFVRSYEEGLPFPSRGYRAFFKKNFIGPALNGAIGVRLGKKYELKAGITHQRFSRYINAKDTLSSVVINLNSTIQHRDYIYFASLNRMFDKRNHIFTTGIGLYYLNPRQQEIEYGYGMPSFITISESKNGALAEGGVFAEAAYEYKFQPKVNVGIRGQFYYTLSAGYAESVALFPFIKINF